MNSNTLYFIFFLLSNYIMLLLLLYYYNTFAVADRILIFIIVVLPIIFRRIRVVRPLCNRWAAARSLSCAYYYHILLIYTSIDTNVYSSSPAAANPENEIHDTIILLWYDYNVIRLRAGYGDDCILKYINFMNCM